MNNNQILGEFGFDKNDVKSQLVNQIQNEETKDTGWIFDKNDLMKATFCETSGLNESNYVKNTLRKSAIFIS